MIAWYWLIPVFIIGLFLGAFIYYRLVLLAARIWGAIEKGISEGLLASRPGPFSPM